MLYKHYTASQIMVFKQFRLGVCFFFTGLVGIYGNYNLLQPSMLQELFLFASLAMIGVGFIIAMLAQIRMLVNRIIHFIHM